MHDELPSSNSSILKGFHKRIVESDEIETSVLSTKTMPHTASVCPFKYFWNTLGAEKI